MKLHERLGIDIEAVDQSLRDVIDTDADLDQASPFYEAIRDMIDSGGKRVRPMLVLVGGRFGSAELRQSAAKQAKLMRIAAMLEYVHMASLVHDDVIDQANVRRGQQTLHRKTDPRTAVHLADYMMARALEWASAGDSGAEQAMRIASLASQLVRGEYRQLDSRFRFDASLDAYLDKTRAKTAVLIAASLTAGAQATEADADTLELLQRFGDAVGVAFQIRDDVLDFVQSSDALGKPSGSDLRSGNATLPVLYAMEKPELAERIRRLHPGSDEGEFERLVGEIANSDAISRSMALCGRFAAEAEAIAERLSGFPAHRDLVVLLDYFAKREA